MLNSKKGEKSRTWTGELLDDLTHLEVNTIIKHGMTAAAQPDSIEEMLSELVHKYRRKLDGILQNNDVDFKVGENAHHTIKTFHDELNALQEHLDTNDIRLDEADYIMYMRFRAFCVWSDSKKDVIKVNDRSSDKAHTSKKLYELDLSRYAEFSFVDLSPKDKAKVKRMYDLGTETVVLQTRFGIDGDVVTRIEKDFAHAPRQIILDLHDKHTNLSLGYWQKLINVAVNVIKEMVK